MMVTFEGVGAPTGGFFAKSTSHCRHSWYVVSSLFCLFFMKERQVLSSEYSDVIYCFGSLAQPASTKHPIKKAPNLTLDSNLCIARLPLATASRIPPAIANITRPKSASIRLSRDRSTIVRGLIDLSLIACLHESRRSCREKHSSFEGCAGTVAGSPGGGC